MSQDVWEDRANARGLWRARVDCARLCTDDWPVRDLTVRQMLDVSLINESYEPMKMEAALVRVEALIEKAGTNGH